MNTPKCEHFDFAYDTYGGERLYWCAVRGGRVDPKVCARCENKKDKRGGEAK